MLLRETRYFESIPDATLAVFDSMPREVIHRIKEHMREQKTQLSSTHPPMRLRIERAKKTDEPGTVVADVPSTKLFVNFPVLCKVATMVKYDMVLGVHPGDHLLLKTEDAFPTRSAPVKERTVIPFEDLPDGDLPLV